MHEFGLLASDYDRARQAEWSAMHPLEHLERRGYALLKSVFGTAEMNSLAERLSDALHDRHERTVLRSRGRVYGSRNLLDDFPQAAKLVGDSELKEVVLAVLGVGAGIVRVLFFGKPPDRSWSLPWHKDRTIAVKRNDLPSDCFRKPTLKAGVPHVEAPASLLANMLTLRVHLDAMTAENGPLSVIPGSHRADEDMPRTAVELHADAGDVLAMRPLLSHASGVSRPGITMHRRVIHFELAAREELADGYQWHSFVPVA